jgi:hypothetical protein
MVNVFEKYEFDEVLWPILIRKSQKMWYLTV